MRHEICRAAALLRWPLALAGCDKPNERQLQGWVEAETVFVSPDEQGRVEVLKVRQGDQVEKGDLLFTLDDDLQKADVVVKQAAVSSAQQAFDRAEELLKSASGTQKTLDDAWANLRQAQANLDAVADPADAPARAQPGGRLDRGSLFPAGRNRAAGPAGGRRCCRRAI